MSREMQTVLITGASTGIGSVYADRFARRGHDLVLVARDEVRMKALAARLQGEAGVSVDILQADLTNRAELAAVEDRLRRDEKIDVLINNAGAAAPGGLMNPDPDVLENLIQLNVTALTRLASAAAQRFAASRHGAIVNVSSILALIPELNSASTPRRNPMCLRCRNRCIRSWAQAAFTCRPCCLPPPARKSGSGRAAQSMTSRLQWTLTSWWMPLWWASIDASRSPYRRCRTWRSGTPSTPRAKPCCRTFRKRTRPPDIKRDSGRAEPGAAPTLPLPSFLKDSPC